MTYPDNGVKSSRFKLLKIYPHIVSYKLNAEIQRRKIPHDLANQYLWQVLVVDRKSQQKRIALALQNVSGGLDLSIPCPAQGTSYKTSIGENTYTYIHGSRPEHIEIFKSFWDFLTWRAMLQKPLSSSVFILNGRKSMDSVISRITAEKSEIKSVMDFLDNDAAGDSLSEQLMGAMHNIAVRYACQSYLYAKYKDLSDYWVNDSMAQRTWPIS